MKRIKEDNTIKYLDDNSRTKMEMVYDEGKITQIRFYLDDEDETISDKKLYVDHKRFKDGYAFSYVRRSTENGIKRVEHYDNDIMTSYSLEERTPEYKLTQIFTAEGVLFDESKVFYNKNGIPYRLREWTKGLTPQDDTLHDSSLPIIEGFEDASKMTKEDWKTHFYIISEYLYSDQCQPYAGGDEMPF